MVAEKLIVHPHVTLNQAFTIEAEIDWSPGERGWPGQFLVDVRHGRDHPSYSARGDERRFYRLTILE
jgi:hypothetical protein